MIRRRARETPPAKRLLLALPLSGLAAAALSAQPPLVRDGLDHTDPQVAAELPRFLSAPAAHFLDWLADGSILINAEQAEDMRIERLRAPPAAPEMVGSSAGTASAIVARPYTSDAFISATPRQASAGTGASTESDPNATENTLQLSLQQIGAGARVLGDTRAHSGLPAWAHDGKQLAFIGGDGGVDVIDTADAAATARQVIAGGSSRWRVLGWSIDDATLLLGRDALDESEPGGDDPFEPYLASVKDGTLQPLAPPGALRRRSVKLQSSALLTAGSAVVATEARFASDGRTILLLTRTPCGRRELDASSRFLHLCSADPAAGEWRAITAPAPHDVELFDASPDGSWIAYTLQDGGISRLMLHDLRLQSERTVDALAPGVVKALRFDATGMRLAVSYESPGTAGEVDVLDPRSASLMRWTGKEATLLDAAAQITPQLVHFPTWDQIDGEPRQLSALLYSPNAAAEDASRRAVVIDLCGGSAEPCRASYDPLVQYLVQRLGFVVLAAAVRESPDSAPRDDAVRDVGALLVWLGLQPRLDGARVAVIGEGFGSYLALASLAQFGDRLKGAVAAFPARLGPLPNALAIRRPLLLVQGLADAEVPSYQIAQLREALRASGVPVQYLAAGEEGRRFRRAANREAYGEAAATFLAHLLR